MKSMGAVIGTLLAELTVPVVQYIILRKELPYKRGSFFVQEIRGFFGEKHGKKL